MLPEGGIGIFEFGFGYFLDRFFGFGGHCGLRIFRFLISIWFWVFVKNTSGFSVLVPDVIFGFWKGSEVQ